MVPPTATLIDLDSGSDREGVRQGATGVMKRAYTNVLVFCASSESCHGDYHAVASRLGTTLARAGMSIIYGGGRLGSMGALADAALEAQGRVIGIQPRFMSELGWTHAGITELHIVDDMQERKRRMLAAADAIVALPGGTGTLEELFDAITAKRLGHFLNPIVIVNQNGFWDPLVAQLARCVEERFLDERHRLMWQVVDEPEKVVEAFAAATTWSKDALEFASV